MFFFAGETAVKFDIRDFSADSKGIHLSILSQDPTIVNIYYILITGNKAIYISEDKSVPISSGMSLELYRPWHQILDDGNEYSGKGQDSGAQSQPDKGLHDDLCRDG